MASVELINVSKNFGAIQAVRDVSLEVQEREFVVFVGPSGCGKSTLLRMIAGLEDISSGELRLGGKRMNEVHAADRGIAMVFQSYALYPHMTVAENMGFGLRMSGVSRAEVEAKVAQTAAVLQIEDLLTRRPKTLSGGQRQRVAIGRAITRNPQVFLFDEPLSNLDSGLRAQMRLEIARLHAELATTMIYVTHDQVEAMTLANRIVILNKGRIEQQGAPLDLYEAPDNMFVAGFLGQPRINFIEVTAVQGAAGPALRIASGDELPIPRGLADVVQPGARLVLGARPDTIRIETETSDDGIPARLERLERLGSETLLHVRLPGIEALVTVAIPGKVDAAQGFACRLVFDPDRFLLFVPGGARLRPAQG